MRRITVISMLFFALLGCSASPMAEPKITYYEIRPYEYDVRVERERKKTVEFVTMHTTDINELAEIIAWRISIPKERVLKLMKKSADPLGKRNAESSY